MTAAIPRHEVLDSYALLALIRTEPAADEVSTLLSQALAGEIALSMTLMNLGEVLYRVMRTSGPDEANRTLDRMLALPIEYVEADLSLTVEAAWLKGEYRMSYADCVAAALALRLDAPVVTGDPEFRQVEERVRVHWLPSNRTPQ